MNKRAAQALEESIEKWRQIERGEMVDWGADNCSLCMEFNKDSGCMGCPVRKATRKNFCRGTPYKNWDDAQARLGKIWSIDKVADTPELIRIARAERKFLESLRDK